MGIKIFRSEEGYRVEDDAFVGVLLKFFIELVGVFWRDSQKFIGFELGEGFWSFRVDDPAFAESFGYIGERFIFEKLIELSKSFRIFCDTDI